MPKRLRYLLHRDPKAAGAVLHILLGALRRTRYHRNRTPGAAPDAKFGAVSFLHRFGASLNSHFHYHLCVLDGVYETAEEEEGENSPSRSVRFHEGTALTRADVATLPFPQATPPRPVSTFSRRTARSNSRRVSSRWAALRGPDPPRPAAGRPRGTARSVVAASPCG